MRSLRRHPVYQLTVTRFREFTREPGAVFWVLAFPILISLALGLAFRSQGPTPVSVAVVESDDAARLLGLLKPTTFFAAEVMPEEKARKALQSGRVSAVVMPGPAVLTDETVANAPLLAAAVKDALERGSGRPDLLAIPQQTVTGIGNRYIDFLIPGVLGMNLMSSSIWGVGWSLVQLRTRKLLKRLAATPMKRSHLLASFVFYRLALAVLEVGVLVVFGMVVFGVRVQGSVPAMAAASVLGVLAFSGLALLTASRAQNAETASGLMNLITMPMSVVSGVFFSWERFPEWLHPVIRALPLTALNDALRAIINEGAGFAEIAPQILVMGGWAVVAFALAVKLFRWN